MKRIKKDTLLLLTACVHPKGMAQTALQDGEKRLGQYIEAIRFYLVTYTFKILVVENTGVDLSPYFLDEIACKRLECMTFFGNGFDRKLGKGYGEGLIINHAFLHSSFIKEHGYIIKVSGRHKILNLHCIVLATEIFLNKNNSDLIVSEVNTATKFARSDCFIASKSFYKKYLNEGLKKCNDSKNVWFENVLFECILESIQSGYQYLYLPFALEQKGISGTTGNKFRKTRLRRKLHFFGRMLLYKFKLKTLD